MSDVLLPVCRLADIPMQGSRIIERRGDPAGNIAVFRGADDRVFAIRDRCPHRGGPLADGIVSVTGDALTVTCPLHNWRIAVDCGDVVKPSGQEVPCVRTYPARVEEGYVAVRL